MAQPDDVSLTRTHPSPERTSRRDYTDSCQSSARLFEHSLVALVCLFAFLLASFPARNSDVWMHLAAGKRIADGALVFGVLGDQTWIYDLLNYSLYRIAGGGGIVFFKAILVVALSLVLFRSSKAGRGWNIPVFCTALAVLTMSMRLHLQPATVSCLMLALCFSFMNRKNDRLSPVPLLPLAILFLVWANLDGGFILGLAAVALVSFGKVLDKARKTSRDEKTSFCHCVATHVPRLVASLSALALVCMLNPVHIHAFQSLSQLVGSSRTATSVFQRSYLNGMASSPTGVAYFALLALGVLSFAGNRSRWHWQWFLPWAGFAVLSICEIRMVPFFAVVAGPVLAWNLQEFWAMRSRSGRSALSGFLFSRLIPVSLLVILIGLAWPGWLQAPPYEPRRWAIETAPSLEAGARTSERWRREGKFISDAQGLHVSRESAAAFAWFCPEEKGVLNPDLTAAVLEERTNWPERLRSEHIDHVIVYDSDRDRLLMALERFLAEPEQWPLLYFQGDLAVFGWRDPLKGESFEGLGLDVNRLAFHPDEHKKAPWNRPEHEPSSRHWWHAFWKPALPRSLDRDEATLLLLQAEAMRKTAPFRHLVAWEASQAVGIIASANTWMLQSAFLDAHVRLVLFRPELPRAGAGQPLLDRLALIFQQQFKQERDDTPAASLYLAIRAARRALAINPDDAYTYSILGECYLRLLHNTREAAWVRKMPELALLRQAQASAALNQAVRLDPHLVQAHLNLGALYAELGYIDLALTHQRAHFDLVRRQGPPSGTPAEKFREEISNSEHFLNELSIEVERRSKLFAADASRLRILDRASLALEKGLAGKAREILLESDIAAFGPQGMAMELELLLRTGRVKDIREWTGIEQKANLGAADYHWLRVQAFAASGDYALALKECAHLATGDLEEETVGLPEQLALAVGKMILDGQPTGRSVPKLLFQARSQIESFAIIRTIAKNIRQEANATVIQGLIALEQGDIKEANDSFRRALAFWKVPSASPADATLDFKSRGIAQACLALIK